MSQDKVTQALIEAGILPTNSARLTQEFLEVIKRPTNSVRMTQLFVEVVLHKGAPALTVTCPQGSTTLTVGVNYQGQILAVGGTPPYTFVITSGALPPGLTLNSSTGFITGKPTSVGNFSYTVTATDSLGLNASASCSFVVVSAGGGNIYPSPCP